MVDLLVNRRAVKNVQLVVFDKDGTIVDLYVYWSNMVRLRAERLCRVYSLDPGKHRDGLMSAMGIDLGRRRLKPEGPVGLLPRAVVQKAAERYLNRLGHKKTQGPCEQVFKDVDQASLSRLGELIRPIPGARELLRALKRNDVRIAIATTDKTHRAEVAVTFLGIGKLVDLVVGDDKVKRSKPAPEMLQVIIKTLGIPPERSVMVGDAVTDIEMGDRAGFGASIGVCSGLTDRKRLLSLTPWVARDISKIDVRRRL